MVTILAILPQILAWCLIQHLKFKKYTGRSATVSSVPIEKNMTNALKLSVHVFILMLNNNSSQL